MKKIIVALTALLTSIQSSAIIKNEVLDEFDLNGIKLQFVCSSNYVFMYSTEGDHTHIVQVLNDQEMPMTCKEFIENYKD